MENCSYNNTISSQDNFTMPGMQKSNIKDFWFIEQRFMFYEKKFPMIPLFAHTIANVFILRVSMVRIEIV